MSNSGDWRPTASWPILEQRDQRHRSLKKAGYTVAGSTIAKHLSVTSGGDVFLAVDHERIIGLLIDPHTYDARYVRIPEDTGEWALATAMMASGIRDSTLYALALEGLASYRLREEVP